MSSELDQLKAKLVEVEKQLKFFADNCQCPEPEPEPEPPCTAVCAKGLPTIGGPKPGGWGASNDPTKWEVVTMRNDPTKFKVVDENNVNVAHNFQSSADAQQYIDFHICKCVKPEPEPEPEPGPQPTPGTTPYPIKGTPMTTSTTKGQRGPTERHYASGKPDDWTIERNLKPIPFKNYQFVTYTTMGPIEHDDNISIKFGGHHMGKNGWFDCGISFGQAGKAGSSQSCLGTEPKHPSTKLCIVKGKKYDSVLNKKVGVAGVYFTDQNKIELWIDMGNGWDKAAEGTNVGGLKPQAGNQECQLRIDGFDYTGEKNETDPVKLKAAGAPDIHSAIVTEIDVTASATSAAVVSGKGEECECDDE